MAVQKLKRPKKWTTIVIFPVLVFCFTKEKENRMALLELKKKYFFFLSLWSRSKAKKESGESGFEQKLGKKCHCT